MSNSRTDSEALEELRSLGRGYGFFVKMQSLAREAQDGDERALEILAGMLAGCGQAAAWRSEGYFCSAALQALVRSGTEQSFRIILDYIDSLPAEANYGIIELLASLLPAYRRDLSLPALQEMALREQDSAPRAIAIQALCNLYLEGGYPEGELDVLRRVLESFDVDAYFTDYLVDMTRVRMAGRENSAEEDDLLEELLKDVIVEK